MSTRAVGSPLDVSIGVIGGSGLYQLFEPGQSELAIVETPFGKVSLTFGDLDGTPVAFLPRHGTGHTVAPHLINYRANIWALASVGVRAIISSAAVGSVHPDFPMGSLVVVDQYLDRTTGRADTFYDQGSVQHLASADPFCATLHEVAAGQLGGDAILGGTVAVIQGPRFSTRAESQWFRSAGAHLVNMTLYPEVPLASELGIGTVALAYVTDNDSSAGEPLSADIVFGRLKAAQPNIIKSISRITAAVPLDYKPLELIDPIAVAEVLNRGVP
jgi:5'-methylthioadenosine phosphorylase